MDNVDCWRKVSNFSYRFKAILPISNGKYDFFSFTSFFYSADIDSDVISYAEKMIAIWQPARAFVIDIALVRGGEFKIVEINNINSAGFYACDIQKFVFAIENMAFLILAGSSLIIQNVKTKMRNGEEIFPPHSSS